MVIDLDDDFDGEALDRCLENMKQDVANLQESYRKCNYKVKQEAPEEQFRRKSEMLRRNWVGSSAIYRLRPSASQVQRHEHQHLMVVTTDGD